MEIAEEGSGVRRRFHVVGEIDLATAPELRHAFDLALAAGVRELDLDLTEVEFIDSSGLGAILRACRHLEGSGRVRLIGPLPHVRRMLELSGVPQLVEIVSAPGEPTGV